MFLSAGCSLLRAEGFSCSLESFLEARDKKIAIFDEKK
jgi:hypothetical protein